MNDRNEHWKKGVAFPYDKEKQGMVKKGRYIGILKESQNKETKYVHL
jgi:hypothetical protein